MLPKEHGAYGQLLFPLGTALAVGHPGSVALLLAAAAVCAFLSHEPLLVLLGQRGARASREQRARALTWFGAFAAAAMLASVTALSRASADVRAALAIPAVLAALLAIVIVLRHEHSALGELVAAVTFSSLAYPVALAAGVPAMEARTCAAVFAAVFVAGTIGVRAVIASTRQPPAVETRLTAGILTGGFIALLWTGAHAGLVAASAPWAALPACALAVALAAAAPSAKRLRTVGWTLVAATAFAAVVLIPTLR